MKKKCDGCGKLFELSQAQESRAKRMGNTARCFCSTECIRKSKKDIGHNI